jgi:hypothetical protein
VAEEEDFRTESQLVKMVVQVVVVDMQVLAIMVQVHNLHNREIQELMDLVIMVVSGIVVARVLQGLTLQVVVVEQAGLVLQAISHSRHAVE